MFLCVIRHITIFNLSSYSVSMTQFGRCLCDYVLNAIGNDKNVNNNNDRERKKNTNPSQL